MANDHNQKADTMGTTTPSMDKLVDKIRAMNDGDSFFIPWTKPEDLRFIRRAGYRAGATLVIVFTEHDEVDQVPGTRVQKTGPLPDSEA